MNRVIVTGARGFIGQAIARLLTDRGWDVIRTATGSAPGHVTLDLLDETAVRRVMREVAPTHLVHAAWKPVRGDVMRSPDNVAWLRASLALVEAFHDAGGRRAAVLGSSAEYDWSAGVCRNGITPLEPGTLYGACKHALHVALAAYARTVGLGFVWPRIFFVYGPGEHESRLTASVIRSIVNGEPAACTHGEQVRDYLHVDDVARGVVAALESDYDGAVDIAHGSGIAVRDLVLQIARALGREDLLRLGARPSPVHDVPFVVGDGSDAERLFGWRPQIDLATGIASTIAWGRTAFTRP